MATVSRSSRTCRRAGGRSRARARRACAASPWRRAPPCDRGPEPRRRGGGGCWPRWISYVSTTSSFGPGLGQGRDRDLCLVGLPQRGGGRRPHVIAHRLALGRSGRSLRSPHRPLSAARAARSARLIVRSSAARAARSARLIVRSRPLGPLAPLASSPALGRSGRSLRSSSSARAARSSRLTRRHPRRRPSSGGWPRRRRSTAAPCRAALVVGVQVALGELPHPAAVLLVHGDVDGVEGVVVRRQHVGVVLLDPATARWYAVGIWFSMPRMAPNWNSYHGRWWARL